MRRHTTTALQAVLCLAPVLVAWTTVSNQLQLQPESRLWVDGTSTVRSFTCEASAFEADVQTVGPGAVTAVVDGAKAVTAVTITVPAERLDCRNGKMNDHMRKAIKATEHPVIGFRLASYDVARAAEGVQGTMTGTLRLGGVEKQIAIAANAKEGDNGTLRVTGTHEIRMSEFGLKPPSLMMGTMKVGDRVTVGFDLYLKD